MSHTPKITGIVQIDLRNHPRITRGIQEAVDAPAGAAVYFIIDNDQLPDWEGLAYLRNEGSHIGEVVFCCSRPSTITAWVHALRGVAA